MSLDTQRTHHRYWTIGLAGLVLGVVLALVFIVPLFTNTLNTYSLLGFPAGFYIVAQGAVLIMVVLIFWAAGRQETFDRKLGAAEDS